MLFITPCVKINTRCCTLPIFLSCTSKFLFLQFLYANTTEDPSFFLLAIDLDALPYRDDKIIALFFHMNFRSSFLNHIITVKTCEAYILRLLKSIKFTLNSQNEEALLMIHLFHVTNKKQFVR